MINGIQSSAEKRMNKTIEVLSHDLARLRTGRAHAGLLDSITIMYYEVPTPINQVASIVVQDSRTLMVTPFDKSTVNAVDKAIRTSELGLNPVVAGQVIRIPLPPLTEERRLILTKQMKTVAEKARVSVRSIRRDANQSLKDLLKKKSISEDEEHNSQDAIQKLTDKYVEKIDQFASAKEADLMQI